MKTVIHIGLPKCASTSLQANVFPGLADFYYCGVGAHGRNNHSLLQCLKRDNCSDNIQLLKEYYASKQDHNLVFSEEAIANYTGLTHIEKAKILKEIFPKAEILCVIRKPVDLMRSAYLWDMKCLKWGPRRQFCSPNYWLSQGLPDIMQTNRCILKFKNILEPFVERFDHVKIIPFELLKSEGAFSSELAGFLDYNTAEVDSLLKKERMNEAITDIGYQLSRACVDPILENGEAFEAYLHGFEELSNGFAQVAIKNVADNYEARRSALFDIIQYFESCSFNYKRCHVDFSQSSLDIISKISAADVRWIEGKFNIDLKKHGYYL